VGDAVEPGTEPIGLPDRPCLAGQDHERGLEGVFGVVGVAEQALTDTEDERSVPHDQGCEGRLGFCASVRREALQQLAIGQSGNGPAVDDRAEVSRHSHSHDPDASFLFSLARISSRVFYSLPRRTVTLALFLQ
jgi:hypothetical protein